MTNDTELKRKIARLDRQMAAATGEWGRPRGRYLAALTIIHKVAGWAVSPVRCWAIA